VAHQVEAASEQSMLLTRHRTQTEGQLRDRERDVVSLRSNAAVVTEENNRLRAEKKRLQERDRAEQRKFAADIQRHLDAQNQALKTLDRSRAPRQDTSKLASLDAQVGPRVESPASTPPLSEGNACVCPCSARPDR